MILPTHFQYLNELTTALLHKEWETTSTEYLELQKAEKELRQSLDFDFRKLRILTRKKIANAQERKFIKEILDQRQGVEQ